MNMMISYQELVRTFPNNARTANPSAYPQGISPGHTPAVGLEGAIEGRYYPWHSGVTSYLEGPTRVITVECQQHKLELF
ncbi:hypothetical protein KCA24_20545, partial [Escherichia coli]|nr:hypothetical protein [Escherichia coli]